MAYRSTPTLLATLTLLLACGPGDSDTTGNDDSTGTTAPSTSTTGTTTSEPTTGSTSEPTTGSTSDPTSTTGTTSTTSTTSGSTTDDPTATTGEATCPDTLPAEGTPCDSEGLFCNSGCEDPCSFCNVVKCEGGTWMGLEVAPAPCLSCDEVCEFVVPAACAGGPPDQAACVTGCMGTLAGDCGLLFNQMLACVGPAPTFTCGDTAMPIVTGCETSFDALYACMRG